MKYSIGLDCGIASVGYAVMELDMNDEPARIIRLGSRIFDAAEHPNTGASLALPRREARGARRRLRRHKHRLQRIRQLLIQENVLTAEQLDNLYSGTLDDIYMLRTKALDERLTNTEFARVLIHLAQRRGFKSNRKSDKNDKEAGKLLSAVSNNQILMKEKGYRTAGEMFYKDEYYAKFKRNKADEYKSTVSRDMIEAEAHIIFKTQRDLGNEFACERIEGKYTEILLSQRAFSEGPGEGPYAGNQIEKMIGKCTLIEGEQRAPKSAYSFQLFNLWQKINNIKLVAENGERINLTNEQRKSIFDLCHRSPSVTYEKIRKELNISSNYIFNSLSYGENNYKEIEKKAKFDYLKDYHELRIALNKIKKGYISSLSTKELNEIGYAFNVHKDNDEQIKAHLTKHGIDDITIETLIENVSSFSGFGHISIKACDMIIPFLEQGLTYDKACEKAGIDFKSHSGFEKSVLLPAKAPELNDITNPVVRRAVSQTIKVVNAIIREQGKSPAYINIELARDLSKDFDERNVIKKKNEENRSVNERVIERCKEDYNIINPTGMDIVKLKLFEEQNGYDPYTQRKFEPERLFEIGYVDVDHIVPYSLSFDDSYNNKVLTFSSENRQKGNRLPLQYLNGKDQDNFRVWVNNTYRNYNKKKNLLKEKIDDDNEFKSRNLNDTRYLSRFIFNYINDYLTFDDYKNKVHVKTVNGAVTSYMRKRWGITKIRENGDLHHAVDAAVIACVTNAMIQKVTRYSNYQEIRYSDNGVQSQVVDSRGEVTDSFPLPYPNFRKELEIRTLYDPLNILIKSPLSNYTQEEILNVKPCFVSRMPRHKVTGPAHKETIRSGKKEGFTVSKVPISKLKLDKYGEIDGYYRKEDDILLYNALLERLKEYNGDAKKAFPDGFYHKPKSDGSEGPVVKSVKIEERSSSNVLVRGDKGIAANGSMIRIDVFFVKGEGYYFVPIYVADTVAETLPNKACVRGKEWKEMDDKDFVFSLYPNDLIKVTAKKDIKMSVNLKGSTLAKEHFTNNDYFYYIKAGIGTSSITVENHDGSYIVNSLGLKTLQKIEKYTVDVLGNINKVGKEKRMTFSKGK